MSNKKENIPEKQEQNKKLDRDKILFICVIAALVVLIVLICVGHYRSKHNPQGTEPASITTQSTAAVPETSRDMGITISNANQDTAVQKNGKWALPHQDRLVDEERVGVYHIIIPSESSKPDYYYFDGGVWQPDYNGICYRGDDQLIIHNGKWDPNFTGFMAYNHYLRYTVKGLYQYDFNGTIYFGEKPNRYAAKVKNGAVLGFELDRDDGFIYPVNDWSLKP